MLERGANLEHYVSNWTDCGGALTLQAGRDFDHVILSVTHACLPYVVEPRIRDAWQPMLRGIQNVQTQALQLWLGPDMKRLGWDESPNIQGAYIEPFSSITDFTHLLARENWPATAIPGSLTYTCGVLQALPGEDQAQAQQRVWDHALTFCTTQMGPVYPDGVQPGDPQALDWSKLYCLDPAQGQDVPMPRNLREPGHP